MKAPVQSGVRTTLALLAALCGVSFPAFSQQTVVSSQNPVTLRGVTIASGTITITPVTQYKVPLGVTSADYKLQGNQPFAGVITAGVVSGLTVPDQLTATTITGAPLWYDVLITSGKDQFEFMLPPGTVTGATFQVDHYVPVQSGPGSPAGVTGAATLPYGGRCFGAGIVYTYTGAGTTGAAVSSVGACVGGKVIALPGGTSAGINTVTVTTGSPASGSVTGTTLALVIPAGAPGTNGTNGTNGTAGTNGTNAVQPTFSVTVTPLAAGATPTAAVNNATPTAPVIQLGIPAGAAGTTPTFTVGTVATGAAGSAAAVTISGTAPAYVLNFTLPQGTAGTGGSGTSIALKVNGTANGSQTVLNLVAGAAITLTDNGSGNVTVAVQNATSTNPGAVQLPAGQTNAQLATVAITGAYGDLTGKPTLGTAAGQNATAFDAAGAAATVQTGLTNEASSARAAEAAATAKGVSAPTAYALANAYAQYALVTYGGIVYQAQQAIAANTASSTPGSAPTYWSPIADGPGAAIAVQSAFATSPSAGFSGTGVLAYYKFDEVSGTTLTDYSGTGNAGTITTTPVRNGLSYTFTGSTQNVTLPAALNSTTSFYFVITIPTTNGGQSPYNNNNLQLALSTNQPYSSSTPYTGMRINLGSVSSGPWYPSNTAPGEGALSLSYVGQGANYAASTQLTTGTHIYAVVCGSSTVAFYVDGVLANTVSATCGTLTSGYAFTFGPDYNGRWPMGMSYFAALFTNTTGGDSAAVVLARSQALRSVAIAKGAPFAGNIPVAPIFTPYLFGVGDSILCGFTLADGKCTTAGGGTSPNSFLAQLPALLTNTYTAVNYGVPSSYVQEEALQSPYNLFPFGAAAGVQENSSIAIMQGGTNNLASYTPAQIFAFQAAWAKQAAANGFRPVLQGVTSRTGYDTQVQALNAYQRANWKNSAFLAYSDVGTDPLLGQTGAYSNTTYFYTDGLHLAAGGHTRVAQMDACTINALDGSGSENMNPVDITASSTTLTSADGGRYLNPTSAAVSVTLFSAMWQTERMLRYCNDSTASTYAATLTAPSDAPFLTASGSATSMTIPFGSCVRLKAKWNGSVAAPLVNWMVQ